MNDLISRQAAVELAMKYCPDDDGAVQCDGDIRGLLDELENLPPAQPEPQEGRFERNRDGVFCSVCHYGWKFITGVPAEVEREYRYCPNCGAKMGGGADVR